MFPKIVEIGPMTLHTYGLLLAVAFLLGIWWTSRLATKEGINADTIWNIGLIVIASSLIGAKLLLVIVEFDYYRANPSAIFSRDLLQSGGVFLGGVIAALAATGYYLYRNRLPWWKLADLFAPGLAVGHALGRVGCFAAGCCYGTSCSLPWAVTYSDEFAHTYVGVPLHTPMHPTQLYEAAAEFITFLGLMWLLKRKRFDGQIILAYLMTYSCVRFILEFFRGDANGTVFGGWLTTSQLICAIALPAALCCYWWRIRLQAAPKTAPNTAQGRKKKR
jgi:phosphatidylglycerol---prolipoprotein diacylglyceryl transferase